MKSINISQSIQPLRKIRNVRLLKHASFIGLKVGVSLDYGVSLHFVLLLALQICWATFQAKNNTRSATASPALTLALHWSHNTCTVNCHICGSGERNGAQKRTKASFSGSIYAAYMQHICSIYAAYMQHICNHWVGEKAYFQMKWRW